LGDTHCTDLGVLALSSLPLQTFYYSGSRWWAGSGLTNYGARLLGALSSLRKVVFTLCEGVTDAGVSALVANTHLEHVGLSGCSITDVGMQAIATLSHLHTLDASTCDNVTDAGVMMLTHLKHLSDLDVTLCDVTDASVIALAPLSLGLRRLELSHVHEITDVSTVCLSTFTALLHLSLSGSNVTDAGVQNLAGLLSLQTLRLTYCRKLTDASLIVVSGLCNLERVCFGGWTKEN
jgi:Leucine-rich repeat (LRR) protein